MKNFTYLLFIVLTAMLAPNHFVQAQGKYIDKNGKITFEASEKLFEEVKAENQSATAILDTDTNQIASLALVKGFRFKNSLMEEHFNENYIESETYPKAIFKGNLPDFDYATLTGTPMEVKVEGKLELHGAEKDIDTLVWIHKMDDIIYMKGDFKVTPQDFDIAIPKIVRNKIAKEVQVHFDFKLLLK